MSTMLRAALSVSVVPMAKPLLVPRFDAAVPRQCSRHLRSTCGANSVKVSPLGATTIRAQHGKIGIRSRDRQSEIVQAFRSLAGIEIVSGNDVIVGAVLVPGLMSPPGPVNW